MEAGAGLDDRRLQQGAVDKEDIDVPACRACIRAQCSHTGISVLLAAVQPANNGATPEISTKQRTAETSLSKSLTLFTTVG
jgi:hypothetical protein